MNVTFVTGNANKAKYFSELIGLPIKHQAVDTHEIQSLDAREIGEQKARQAYAQLKSPVLIEDVSLRINALGKLPGPFIKWFIEEIGLEHICRLADSSDERGAVASCIYVYFDGNMLKTFEGSLKGTVADRPRGRSNFGWNSTFIPAGESLTLGEMEDKLFKEFYLRIKPIVEVRKFLETIDF